MHSNSGVSPRGGHTQFSQNQIEREAQAFWCRAAITRSQTWNVWKFWEAQTFEWTYWVQITFFVWGASQLKSHDVRISIVRVGRKPEKNYASLAKLDFFFKWKLMRNIFQISQIFN